MRSASLRASCVVVGMSDADEHTEPRADLAHDLTVNGDLRSRTRCTSARTRADPTVCAVLTLTGDDLIVMLDPVQGGRIASIVAFGEERLVVPRSMTRRRDRAAGERSR